MKFSSNKKYSITNEYCSQSGTFLAALTANKEVESERERVRERERERERERKRERDRHI